jgi:hypothetical protein
MTEVAGYGLVGPIEALDGVVLVGYSAIGQEMLGHLAAVVSSGVHHQWEYTRNRWILEIDRLSISIYSIDSTEIDSLSISRVHAWIQFLVVSLIVYRFLAI